MVEVTLISGDRLVHVFVDDVSGDVLGHVDQGLATEGEMWELGATYTCSRAVAQLRGPTTYKTIELEHINNDARYGVVEGWPVRAKLTVQQPDIGP